MEVDFKNPYRPGAGHMPPHLAGREEQFREFDRLLEQDTILENLVLTGLRGVGKTVLLERFKPRAITEGWLWAGTDMSESASVTEANLSMRLLADLSTITSVIEIGETKTLGMGFGSSTAVDATHLTYNVLAAIYEHTPGLVVDKLKAALEFAANQLQLAGHPRVIFAYDEAQNLADNADADEFPLSVLLDVFQSIQKKGVPFMLVLTGLPTLFPKLVDARTYSERMFRVVTLGRLDDDASRDAIRKPVEAAQSPLQLSDESVETICTQSGGYPYFIQFICREVYDVFIQKLTADEQPSVPVEAIQRKLDSDFFAGRWGRATDRQRDLLFVVANLESPEEEFSINDLVAKSKELVQSGVLEKAFSASHASQMLVTLGEQGLIYKNRFGRYAFAVPLLSQFILREFDRSLSERPGF
ncbi:MAG: ATP-binding protein [Solirubrobacterales bacterium]